ncbi:MAG: hypothetical protein QOH37_1582 [Nocardioidaceae bacterium]|jgi:hypothetical protein|nr:hypothetical protein [Nocardioidaceae bacterium]
MADDQATPAGRARPGRESEVARRKRLDEVFGDVLPETTNDERDDRDAGGDASDRWLREQVPPHHGG